MLIYQVILSINQKWELIFQCVQMFISLHNDINAITIMKDSEMVRNIYH